LCPAALHQSELGCVDLNSRLSPDCFHARATGSGLAFCHSQVLFRLACPLAFHYLALVGDYSAYSGIVQSKVVADFFHTVGAAAEEKDKT
jgi:hypothetical protein